jgi:hypothetical protein
MHNRTAFFLMVGLFITVTIASAQFPGGGFPGGGPPGGGPFGGGRPPDVGLGGPPMGPPPRPGEVLPRMMRPVLNLTAKQEKQLAELQSQVDARLAQILNDQQKAQLEQMRQRGPGPFGPPGGDGPPGGYPGGPPESQGFGPRSDPSRSRGYSASKRPTSPRGIKPIMVRLAKGPNSLTPIISNGLNQERPAWAKIQEQTKEYARLAADLAKYNPPRGTKGSWTRMTADYAEMASQLNDAAHAKDADAALDAYGKLETSCTACHRQHRAGGPGMGPPGGGGRPGGQPGVPF